MSVRIKRNRQSIRLRDYDYSVEGAYFVTLVTYHRLCLFGSKSNGEIELNPSGRIAFDQWTQLGNRFPQSDFSTFVIMPNHVHGIIYINRCAGEDIHKLDIQDNTVEPSKIPPITPRSLGAIVRAYKASVSFRINAMRGFSYPPIWQRNYYEQIICNEKEFENICKYIEANPERWDEDQLRPSNAF